MAFTATAESQAVADRTSLNVTVVPVTFAWGHTTIWAITLSLGKMLIVIVANVIAVPTGVAHGFTFAVLRFAAFT